MIEESHVQALPRTRSRCTRCQGTGWASAARDAGMEDAPFLVRPIGVFQCPSCGGSQFSLLPEGAS